MLSRYAFRPLAERLTHRFVFKRRLPQFFGGTAISVSTEGGLRYLFRRSEDLDPTLYSTVRRCVVPGDVVWDIGANVGLFSFSAAALATRSGSVLAVEPDVWLVGLLRRSAARRQETAAAVDVLPAAMSDVTGISSFSIAKRSRSTNHLVGFGTTQTGGERARISVPTLTLDLISAGRPMPTVLKIDVEGAEVQVLQGAAAVLASHPTVIIEVAGENVTAVDAILRPLGYRYINAETGAASDLPCPDTIAFVGESP